MFFNEFYQYFREHKQSMVKLRKLLSDSSKARRHRRNVVNLQITFLAWFIEVCGFFLLFLGQFILGHENNVVNFVLQLLTRIIYCNILPCIFLLNDSDVKGQIVESKWYNIFLNICNCQYNIQSDNEDAEEIVDNQMHQQNPDENSKAPINSHDGRNENNIESTEQCNIEKDSNKTKICDNKDPNIKITKTNFVRQQFKNTDEPIEPLDFTNEVVVIDLET